MSQQDSAMQVLDDLDTRVMPGCWALAPPSQVDDKHIPPGRKEALWHAIRQQQQGGER